MKRILITLALLFTVSISFADVYVKGYTKNNGTYVAPHYRSSPNSTSYDNYSYRGNTNPYTGQKGYDDGIYVKEHQYNYPTLNKRRRTLGDGSYGF